ncbi:MAG: hydroxymethylglutaryl-CoA reductase, degradative [Bacteroidales bacterium]
MAQKETISGFSKFTPMEKVQWVQDEFGLPSEYAAVLASHLHPDKELQSLYNEFSENTVSAFHLPFGLAPNFKINGKWFVVPMAIEESSVVAAVSNAAKFWAGHGGFNAQVEKPIKTGQVHFQWTGQPDFLKELFRQKRTFLIRSLDPLTASMQNRGGGISDISLVDLTGTLSDYYQLHTEFGTGDAMGANFINTVLEALAVKWQAVVKEAVVDQNMTGELMIVMSILSNFTPGSRVKATVETDVRSFDSFDPKLSGLAFAEKFVRATEIAHHDISRAVTHNKGIFNGIDAVVIATGNDFRAVEACGHAYAARQGSYCSLSRAEISGNVFRFELELPMSVGSVGGLTSLHPLARASLKILQDPGAEELMMIIASTGLASNFSAIRSLITGGIQQGHMKMHLSNILRQLGADEEQRNSAMDYFSNRTVSYADVRKFISDTK